MRRPLEAVPNFSEGRSAETVAALGEALAAHAHVLDVHVDPDHHRSVFTIAGAGAAVADALVAAIGCARERIDLRRHDGVHPRVGAADVVPVVAVWPEQLEEAKAAALTVADRAANEVGLPVFFYGELAPGTWPALLRRGGLRELRRRLAAGELAPDRGLATLDPRTGAVLVGARRPLIAFNVNLASEDLQVAQEIAAVVRETGGGYRGVRALGFPLASRGLVQVSMNVEDWRASPLDEIVSRIRAEAKARGVDVAGSELVGLMPEGAAAPGAVALGLDSLDESRLLEPSLSRLAS
ncbi:MAG TPA: glutamate formimidoyltransferase [Gaiellaceae bacterium]|nr:glutamate formimidoyltransferase [Gaiellaceae bacterium]